MRALLQDLGQDVRFAFRYFARTPLATAAMVAVLALGIGVNSALYAAVRAMTRGEVAAVPRDDALVRIRSASSGREMPRRMSYEELLDHRRQTATLAGVMAWREEELLVSADAVSGQAIAQVVFATSNYFSVLGIAPAVGPGLPATLDAERAADPVALISHSFWQRELGGRADVVGQTIHVEGVPTTIVGVAPLAFAGVTSRDGDRTLWMPLGALATVTRGSPSFLASHDSLSLFAVARLRPGVSLSEATRAAAAVAERASSRVSTLSVHGSTLTIARSAEVVAMRADNAEQTRGQSEALVILAVFGSVTLIVLLVTCTNVAALAVGAAMARQREIAVRLSIGAPRGRIVRQLVTESVLIAFAAGATGLVLLVLIDGLASHWLPSGVVLRPDWSAVAFTAVFALGVGVLFGISPALHATRVSLSSALKSGGAGRTVARSRLQRTLVVAEVALTQPLLVALGATVMFLVQDVMTHDRNEAAARIAIMSFSWSGTRGDREEVERSLANVRARIAELPGVVEVATYSAAHILYDVAGVVSEGVQDADVIPVDVQEVAPRYFSAYQRPLLVGRDFTNDEASRREQVAIIGSTLARRLWGDANPIGKHLVRVYRGKTGTDRLTVVGVVDERKSGPTIGVNARDVLYAPAMSARDAFVVRSAGDAAALVPTIRKIARLHAPRVPIVQARTLADREATRRAGIRQAALAVAGAGLLTLLLAGIGLYTVVAFAVGQRTREVGVRIALGARRAQVIGLFFRGGLRLSAIGLGIGLPLSIIAFQLFAMNVGVRLGGTTVMALAVAGIVVAVSALATWIPARKAAGVDPLITLRSE